MGKITLEITTDKDSGTFEGWITNFSTGKKIGYHKSVGDDRAAVIACMDYMTDLLKGRVKDQNNVPIEIDF